ncbi:terminase ATPase subunit family protein [Paracandidimonas soli]
MLAAMFTQPADHDNRRHAKFLYWQGWALTAIAEYLGERPPTVGSWKRRDKWDQAPVIERIEGAAECRLVQLVMKQAKTGQDFKEIDLLGRQMERYARVRKYLGGGNEVDLNPNLAARNSKPKRRPSKNFISEEQTEKLIEAFDDALFEYQRTWANNRDQRTRIILKSRQIGATWFFAREAFIDALLTGRNQIFISASKAQAHVFKQYILQFVRDTIDVELRGDPIVLHNGATLYFLGTNYRTAQSYHGNLYVDEFFWIPGFEQLNKVASGMAMHKKWRKTYFSTPSSMSHEAYPFWSGERHAKVRGKKSAIKMDISHKALQAGKLCSDKIWRQIVTIFDAEAGGCDLFDIEELRNEYTEDEFDNLLKCLFIDDTKSVFPLQMLQRCMVDSWEIWTDYKPHAARPFGNKPVWIGYDPSDTGDKQGCVVIAPPAVPGGKFRILERIQFQNPDYQVQADEIKKLTDKYNVTHIGIDVTGMGRAVYQLVRLFFPAAVPINYSVEVKTQMVLKMQNVMRNGRLEFDSGFIDLAQSFMSIRKILTPSGRQATYASGRTQAVGHADLAWATMNAIAHEPLEGTTEAGQNIMEMS